MTYRNWKRSIKYKIDKFYVYIGNTNEMYRADRIL